jgi:CO/xanthine dehydrogenase Mo-binding subunit
MHGKVHYGELAATAHEHTIDEDELVLKDAKDWHTIGKPMRRLDSYAKTNGSAVFGIDVQVPNMLIAVVVRSPVLRGSVKSFNDTRAKQVRGVKHVVQIPQGVAVVAENYWQARKGAAALDVEWNAGPMQRFSTDALRARHLELLRDEAKEVGSNGDNIDDALAAAAKKIDGVYEVPFLHHATMEPMNATAFVDEANQKCTIWAPTQSPTVTKEVAARLLDYSHAQVEVVTTYMGGGFGRRGIMDFVSEAVEVSRRVKAPVKVVWSREDDMRNGQLRPASITYVEGGVDANGMPAALRHRIAGQSLIVAFADMVGAMAPEMVPRPLLDFVGSGLKSIVANGHLTDPTAIEGAADSPYAIPHRKVEFALHDSGVPVFPWRSVGHSINAFVVESFMDELAHLGGKDPLEVRRALLKDAPRELGVLEAAANGIGWETPAAPGRFRGIAQHACFNSFCAHAVEISVDGGRLRVHRVVSAIDCGRAINPDLVAAQMESGVIYALSATLKQRIDYDHGMVQQSNFHDYPILRMAETPQIDTIIVPSEERPTGVGELAVPPLAPALANAFFAATGVRLRRMPMQKDIDLVLAGKQPEVVTL